MGLMPELLKQITLISWIMFVTGCASTTSQTHQDPRIIVPPPELISYQFPTDEPTVPVESPEDIFYLSEKARNDVDHLRQAYINPYERAEELVKLIFFNNRQGMLYSNSATLSASEAWEKREANCLSLTILAWAMADEIDLKTEFQQLNIPEYWTHQAGASLLNGHINLKVTGTKIEQHDFGYKRFDSLVIDFDPFSPKKKFSAKEVSRDTVIAMFYNNKAADALLKKHYKQAYQYLTAAINQSPSFVSSWNNLGLVYRGLGENELAEKSYQFALDIEPDKLNIMSNLSVLMAATGRETESKILRNFITKQRLKNPYYHYTLGKEAMSNKAYFQAINHFKSAIDIDDNDHEVWFAMSVAYYRLGLWSKSRVSLREASDLAPDNKLKNQYDGKIRFLNGYLMKKQRYYAGG